MSDVERLRARADRERRARKAAESLIEEKSRQLYHANQRLEQFNQDLEQRVADATAELRENNELLTRRVSELAALNSVAVALTSMVDLRSLLDSIIEVSKEVMNCEAASLLLLEGDTDLMRFDVARGEAADGITKLTCRVGQGIAGHVAQTRRPVLVRDAYHDERFDPSFDQQTGVTTRSLMAVPIQVKDKLVGVVEVLNKLGEAEFDEHDLRLFESFASSVGVTIENARLFQQTQRMAEELREALEKERWLSIEKEKLGAYIPKNVRDEISRNREQTLALGGKTVEVTVMFSDIKGFTAVSEHMPPQELVGFLNLYMTAMTEAIEAHDGFVDKFIGDGIMAIFTEADDGRCHALRAVRAGVAMQERLVELRRDWRTKRSEFGTLAMRVGINTGEVVAGNIGSTTRMDYTVMGDNVNVASRIESVAAPGSVSLSDATYERVRNEVEAVRMDPIHVKNRLQPVQTYSISVDHTPPSE